LKPGDRLAIQRGDEHWVIMVADVTDKRVSAELAAMRYVEDPASIEARTKMSEQRNLDREAGILAGGRPDKRQRRQIIDFIRRKDG